MGTGTGSQRATIAGAAILLTSVLANPAVAAEISWNAPSDCERAEVVRTQIESLAGRPLADVEAPSFEVTVSRDGERWKVELVAIAETGAAPSKRTLEGKSCVEVTDAAGVAMAMAIRANAESQPPPPSEPPSTPEAAPAPPPEPAPPSPKKPAEPPKKSTGPRLGAIVGLAAALDTAALPSPAFGAAANAGIHYGALRLEAQGAAFLPSEVRLSNGQGADFDLMALALLGCIQNPLAFATVHGCGGFELGQLAGEGRRVSNPRLGSVLWQAVRIELGAALPAASGLRFAARLGVALPVSRRQFQLDGNDIHRPGALTLRAALGAEFEQ